MEKQCPSTKIKHPVVDYIHELLTNIATNIDIPPMKLMEYVDYSKIGDILSSSEAKSKVGICQARKQDGQRCTRKSKESSNFCGKHIHNQKYGCVNIQSEDISPTISLTIEESNGDKYLVDSSNIVYQYCDSSQEKVKIIGHRDSVGNLVLIENQEQEQSLDMMFEKYIAHNKI
jgi:hypothetical protein